MHLGKFHAVINTLNVDARSEQTLNQLQGLINHLNTLASSPTNADYAKAFKDQLDAIHTQLVESPLNDPHPTFKAMMLEIGADQYYGKALFERIKGVIADNQLTPSTASSALSKLHSDVKKYYDTISSVDSAFSILEVEYTEISPGENEIGISIPVVEGSRTLKDLSKEANGWHIALAPFVEIFSEDNEPIKLRVMSSSDWQFYLYSTPFVLLGISYSVKNLNKILSNLIETKALTKKLFGSGASPEAIAAVEADTEKRFDVEVKQLAEKIVDENYKEKDEGRKNELKVSMSQSLKFLARQMSRNVTLEIRMAPPEEFEDSDEEPTDETKLKIQNIEALKEIKNKIESYMASAKLDFDSEEILSLGDDTDHAEADKN